MKRTPSSNKDTYTNLDGRVIRTERGWWYTTASPPPRSVQCGAVCHHGYVVRRQCAASNVSNVKPLIDVRAVCCGVWMWVNVPRADDVVLRNSMADYIQFMHLYDNLKIFVFIVYPTDYDVRKHNAGNICIFHIAVVWFQDQILFIDTPLMYLKMSQIPMLSTRAAKYICRIYIYAKHAMRF